MFCFLQQFFGNHFLKCFFSSNLPSRWKVGKIRPHGPPKNLRKFSQPFSKFWLFMKNGLIYLARCHSYYLVRNDGNSLLGIDLIPPMLIRNRVKVTFQIFSCFADFASIWTQESKTMGKGKIWIKHVIGSLYFELICMAINQFHIIVYTFQYSVTEWIIFKDSVVVKS